MSQKTKIVAPFSPTRRSVIVGGCGLAAVLAGCGSDSPEERSAGAPTEDESSPANTSAPPTTPPPQPEGDALASTADVPVGGGVVLEDEQVVIVQPTEGEFKAYTSVCPHQQNPVGSVENGEIVCPWHGSRFAIEDGSVVNGPATKPIAEVAISVDGDQIVKS